jgi:hypothetical protein
VLPACRFLSPPLSSPHVLPLYLSLNPCVLAHACLYFVGSLCSVCDGDVVIHSADELPLFADCTVIQGNLQLFV